MCRAAFLPLEFVLEIYWGFCSDSFLLKHHHLNLAISFSPEFQVRNYQQKVLIVLIVSLSYSLLPVACPCIPFSVVATPTFKKGKPQRD